MASRKSDTGPELFEEAALDPMAVATGSHAPAPVDKRKAGFYLSTELLARFDRKYYELKLSGARVANKSALLEAFLLFALEEMDRGAESRLLQELE